jgi:CHAT domain-containing protein/tetratricopeptide (TPR) repeat protein
MVPDLRQPTEEEARQLDTGWQTIGFHEWSAFPANTISAIDKIKPLVDDTYGPDHPLALRLDTLRAASLSRIGKHQEAEAALAANVAALERRLGPDMGWTYLARDDRALNLVQLGRLAEAAALLEENAQVISRRAGLDPLEQARQGLAIAYVRRLQGRFVEAEGLARLACDAEHAAAAPEPVSVAVACASLARSLTGLGRIDEATTLVRSLLEEHETKDVGRARLIFALAEADAEAGRPLDSLHHYTEAAKLLLDVEGYDAPNTLQATARARLTLVEVLGRSPMVSANIVSDGLPIAFAQGQCEGTPDSLSAAELRLSRAVLNISGEEQRACFERIRDFLASGLGADAPATLDVQERLVELIDQIGDIEPALEEARRLVAAREKVNGFTHPATARAMLLYAQTLSAMGRSQEAEALIRRAAAVLPGQAHSFNARRLDTLGEHQHAAGQWEMAAATLEAGPKQSLRLAIDILAGQVFNAHYQGRCHDEKREEVNALVGSEGYPLVGHYRRPLDEAHAILLACEGKWKEAAAIYQRLTFESVTDGIAHLDANLARLEARRALALLKNPQYYDIADVAARTAVFYARERRYTPARDPTGKPLGFRTASAGMGSDPLAVTFSTLVTLNWAYTGKLRQFGKITIVHDGFDEAFRAAQDFAQSRAAASLLEAAARAAVSDPELGALIDRQAALAARIYAFDQVAVTDSAGAAAGGTSLDGDRRALAALTEELRQRYPAYANTSRPFGLSIAQTRSRLRAGEAVLMIQPIGDAVYSFAISADSTAWHKADVSRTEMDRLVASVRCRLDPGSCTLNLPGEYLFEGKAAAALYQQLVAPVVSGLGDAGTLYTVTGGSLGSIPLGILVVGEPPRQSFDEQAELTALAGTQWLGDRYALATLPSVSSLRAYAAAETGETDTRDFVGIGDPVLGPAQEIARGSSSVTTANVRGSNDLAEPAALMKLSSLPGTRRELLAIARTLGSPEDSLLLAEAATESRVKSPALLANAGIIVFATHAMLPGQIEGNAEPGLVMTPPDEASSSDDGYLTASEAAALNLSADWVVLSACNTAGPADGGSNESLSGLARAFFFAGARSLLVSHWPVLDTVGAAITSETFRIKAARPDLSRAEALQLALRGIRSGTSVLGDAIPGWEPSWSDPWAWAPFSLIESGS